MITGFFPGRIRLRAPVFKDTAITERALSILKAPALSSLINEIEHNLEKEAEAYSEKNKAIILAMLDELEGYVKNWETA